VPVRVLCSSSRSGLMPNDEFWSAIHKRVAAAEFLLNEMSKDILPPSESARHQPHVAAILATGALVDHPWERRFYPHLDAFLAMTRSVPEIIRCLFGIDTLPALKAWLARLDPAERARRQAFQSQFDVVYKLFAAMPLSGARNVTLHRTGVSPVKARLMGRWGVIYVGRYAHTRNPAVRVTSQFCQQRSCTVGGGNRSTSANCAAADRLPAARDRRRTDFNDGTVPEVFELHGRRSKRSRPSGRSPCRLSPANGQMTGNAARAHRETGGRHHRPSLNSQTTRQPRLSALDKSVSRKFEACA
jgi:hypothetical protein